MRAVLMAVFSDTTQIRNWADVEKEDCKNHRLFSTTFKNQIMQQSTTTVTKTQKQKHWRKNFIILRDWKPDYSTFVKTPEQRKEIAKVKAMTPKTPLKTIFKSSSYG